MKKETTTNAVKTKTKNKIQPHMNPRGETVGIVIKTIFMCFILAIAAVGWLIFEWVDDVLAETPEFNPELIFRGQSAEIFDREGLLIMEFGTQRSEWVQFDEISQVMIDAILAIEDARFFEHYGVDWTRTIAAVGYTGLSFIMGEDSMQGGSTLTQQLVNQTHLLHEDGTRNTTIDRKLQEILLATQVEQVFSKEQIIEAYLNIAPFGGRIYGIQAAAQFYFDVDASQLNLSQAATLAGIVQSPSLHRPDWHAPRTQERRNQVLTQMVNHGFITEEIRNLVAAEPITDLLVFNQDGLEDTSRYDLFLNRVREEAYERFGIEDLAGYQIHTTLDRPTQTFVHELVTGTGPDAAMNGFTWHDEDIQTAVAMIENGGAIRALAHRDESNTADRQLGFNFAVNGVRQPGSSAKPIWAYAPAFELLDWGTGSMINDDLFGYDGSAPGSIIVRNWDQRYRGRVSVRNAMEQSWNVPAIKAYQAVVDQIGITGMDAFVETFGIPAPPNGSNQRYAIGGHAEGVSVLEMAGAYAVFPNGGEFREPYTIERIITPDGRTIYQEEYQRIEQVISEGSAYMMNNILRTSLTNGTGTDALVSNQWVAGKTGTTNFDEAIRAAHGIPHSAVPDSWFVGYSMDYTVAVWTGYQNVAGGNYLSWPHEQRISQRLFSIIMTELGNNEGWRAPQQPSTIVSAGIEWQSGTAEGEVCAPSVATPNSATTLGHQFRQSELFHAHATPACTSPRFTQGRGEGGAPDNFSVEARQGLELRFSWDSGSNLALTLEEATTARDRARGAALATNNMTQALLDMSPSEGEAQMLMDQITAVGGGEFAVFAVMANGDSVELFTTGETEYDFTLSRTQAVNARSFYVVARFTGGASSDPSDSVSATGLIDLTRIEVTIPSMIGWTQQQVSEWANNNDIENYTFDDEVYSDSVAIGRVVSTIPTGTMTVNQTLRVTLSLGEEEQEQDIPNIPGLPIPDDEDEPDGGTIDAEELEGINPNMLPGLDDMLQLRHRFQQQTNPTIFSTFGTLQRVKRGEF